jgi:hypothetical protein
MKKLVYIVACCAFAASFAACKDKNKATVQSIPETIVTENVEIVKAPNYDNIIDTIVIEEPVATRSMAHSPTPQYKAVVNEQTKATASEDNSDLPTISLVYSSYVKSKGEPAGAEMVDDSAYVYPYDDYVDVIVVDDDYADRFDIAALDTIVDGKEWKIRTTDNKEVWRAVNTTNGRKVMKFRENHDRDFVKIKADGERKIVKNLDFATRIVEKINLDGKRKIHIDRITPNREIVKVIENSKVTKTVKTRNTERRATIKEFKDGSKEFVKVIAKNRGRNELVKTFVNGERSRELTGNLAENKRSLELIREKGDRLVTKARTETAFEVAIARNSIDSQTSKITEFVEK